MTLNKMLGVCGAQVLTKHMDPTKQPALHSQPAKQDIKHAGVYLYADMLMTTGPLAQDSPQKGLQCFSTDIRINSSQQRHLQMQSRFQKSRCLLQVSADEQD